MTAGVMAHGVTPSGSQVILRSLGDDEALVDSDSEFDDFGEESDRADALPPSYRAAVECDGMTVGHLSWHAVHYGPNRGSTAWNIGINLAVDARGQGIGTLAQRLLAEYLLATTDVDRIEASTDVTNVAEQRALEGAGFTREGVLRQAQLRPDGRHDLVSYSFLRLDVPRDDDSRG